MDPDLVTRLEQRIAALVAELQRQQARGDRLDAENSALRTRVDHARRRLDALLEAVAEEEV